ncbi:MAG: hypothetical protein ACU0CT_02650 [Paracoccaceae bacterium]
MTDSIDNAPKRIAHPYKGPDLPTEVFADPGRHGWYFREKMPDSYARFVRADLAPDPLADAMDVRLALADDPENEALKAALTYHELQAARHKRMTDMDRFIEAADAMDEAVKAMNTARIAREIYNQLPPGRNRIGQPKCKKSRARDIWLKALRRAEEKASAIDTTAYRAAREAITKGTPPAFATSA